MEAVTSSSIAALMDRVRVHVDPTLPAIPTGVTHRSRVRVTARSGAAATREIEDPLGSPAHPVPDPVLRHKFVHCAALAIGPLGAEHAFDAWQTLPGHAPYASWLDSLCVTPAS